MARDDKYVAAFPGRGAFYRGMSPSFYEEYEEFRNIFDAAGNYLKEDLYKISYVDPSIKPEFHTVCLIAHCYALYKIIVRCLYLPEAAIGFSQGEFTAVAAAGAVKFPEVLKLVYNLELLLKDSDIIENGLMVRIVQFDRDKLLECCKRVDPNEEKISMGVYFSSDQNVISGEKDKIEELSVLVKSEGARWVIRLNSGGAFHSPLCKEMVRRSGGVFAQYNFDAPGYPVYSCVEGKASRDRKQVKKMLSKQIAFPILWDKIIRDLRQNGFTRILELGPGCTLSGNIRIIDAEADCRWINNTDDLREIIDHCQRQSFQKLRLD